MQKLNFWTIRPSDTELARKVQRSFNKLYKESPRGYEFALSDSGTSLFPSDGEINFIVGYDLENLLGVARCGIKEPGRKLGEISMLGGLYYDTLSDSFAPLVHSAPKVSNLHLKSDFSKILIVWVNCP